MGTELCGKRAVVALRRGILKKRGAGRLESAGVCQPAPQLGAGYFFVGAGGADVLGLGAAAGGVCVAGRGAEVVAAGAFDGGAEGVTGPIVVKRDDGLRDVRRGGREKNVVRLSAHIENRGVLVVLRVLRDTCIIFWPRSFTMRC